MDIHFEVGHKMVLPERSKDSHKETGNVQTFAFGKHNSWKGDETFKTTD
jgi:hypothetical protein